VSNDVEACTRNPVGCLLYDSNIVAARLTSATAAVCVPTRGVKTFVTNALEIWNLCAELRDAPTKAEAHRGATTLAKNSAL
jgi:hypothetical protein